MAFNFYQLAREITNPVITRAISTAAPKLIHFTPCLFAEPLKKKKRVDPAIVRARDERRKKKVEKQIRRLEKIQLQLKPIEENEIPLALLDEKNKRMRKSLITPERREDIILLKKEWARFSNQQRLKDAIMLTRIALSQEKALDQLRMESEELYQAAVQIDTTLMPFTFEGPSDTPAIENYVSPDGEYLDISKKW